MNQTPILLLVLAGTSAFMWLAIRLGWIPVQRLRRATLKVPQTLTAVLATLAPFLPLVIGGVSAADGAFQTTIRHNPQGGYLLAAGVATALLGPKLVDKLTERFHARWKWRLEYPSVMGLNNRHKLTLHVDPVDPNRGTVAEVVVRFDTPDFTFNPEEKKIRLADNVPPLTITVIPNQTGTRWFQLTFKDDLSVLDTRPFDIHVVRHMWWKVMVPNWVENVCSLSALFFTVTSGLYALSPGFRAWLDNLLKTLS